MRELTGSEQVTSHLLRSLTVENQQPILLSAHLLVRALGQARGPCLGGAWRRPRIFCSSVGRVRRHA